MDFLKVCYVIVIHLLIRAENNSKKKTQHEIRGKLRTGNTTFWCKQPIKINEIPV